MSKSQKTSSSSGPKGGTRYPRYSLTELEPQLKLIASKTTTAALDYESFCMGVFGVGYKDVCQVKMSSLKQFGLVQYEKNQISATNLCRKIALRDDNEREVLFRKAFYNVNPFLRVLQTFSGRKSSASEIGTFAVETVKVHIDNKDDFVEKFIDSAKKAGLCADDQGMYRLQLIEMTEDTTDLQTNIEPETMDEQDTENGFPSTIKSKHGNVKIEVKVDPTLDPEKLEKQLEKLRKYGLI
jgi:hypothetical protein